MDALSKVIRRWAASMVGVSPLPRVFVFVATRSQRSVVHTQRRGSLAVAACWIRVLLDARLLAALIRSSGRVKDRAVGVEAARRSASLPLDLASLRRSACPDAACVAALVS